MASSSVELSQEPGVTTGSGSPARLEPMDTDDLDPPSMAPPSPRQSIPSPGVPARDSVSPDVNMPTASTPDQGELTQPTGNDFDDDLVIQEEHLHPRVVFEITIIDSSDEENPLLGFPL